MDPEMLDILERASAGSTQIDLADPISANATGALESRGWVSVAMDGTVFITDSGRFALSEVHVLHEKARKDDADRAAYERRERNLKILVKSIEVLLTLIGTLLIQFLIRK